MLPPCAPSILPLLEAAFRRLRRAQGACMRQHKSGVPGLSTFAMFDGTRKGLDRQLCSAAAPPALLSQPQKSTTLTASHLCGQLLCTSDFAHVSEPGPESQAGVLHYSGERCSLARQMMANMHDLIKRWTVNGVGMFTVPDPDCFWPDPDFFGRTLIIFGLVRALRGSTGICGGSQAGSYLRLTDLCISLL